MIYVDRAQIANAFDQWRDTDAGKVSFGMSGAFGAAFYFWLCLLTAILLICSVIGIIWGFQLLCFTLKLGPLKADPKWDQLQVLIAPSVIGNSTLAKDNSESVPAMFVASFADESTVPPEKLCKLAYVLAKVYFAEAVTPDEKLLLPIVKEDLYKGDVAARLPERWTGPNDIFAWSTKVDSEKLGLVKSVQGDMFFAAFVGVPASSDGKKIELTQIPWSVVKRGIDSSEVAAPPRPRSKGLSIEARRAARNQRHRGQFLRNLAMALFFFVLLFGLYHSLSTVDKKRTVDEIQHTEFFREKIGKVESCTRNLLRSVSEGRGKLVYNVEGSKGTGTLIVYDRLLRRKRYWLEVDGKKRELEAR